MSSIMTHISPKVRNIRQSELGALGRRANQIKEELRQGVQKPYKHVIDVSWGDSHRAGVKPLTFVRQVLAACLYPQLANSDKLPVDVRERAQRLLEACDGGSVGSYTSTAGIFSVLQNVAKFISQRDGGIPSHPDNIFITPGSQWSIMKILSILVNSENSPSTAVLIPTPCSSSVSMTLEGLGATIVPYYLNEEQGWELQIGELHRALQSAKEVCNPAVLYVNNPGNPTVILPCISHTLIVATIGHVQSRKSIEEVIEFASEQKLFIIADEVYQDSVIESEGMEFVSYKRVLAEMGSPLSDTVELASFHSASKGCMGECGLRGGYVELANLDPAVMKYIYTVFSTDSCAPVTGQMALDLMVNPPQPGDPSYPVFNQEMQNIRAMLVHNVKRVLEVLNSLPGFSCQPVKGGSFVFPRLHLPPAAVQKAMELGMPPDVFYCGRLLEEAGLCVGPGCEHGQREGSYHIRFSVMASVNTVEEGLRRLTSFHLEFMKAFS